MTEKTKGELAIVVAAMLYGFVGVFSRLINFQIPLYFQQWVRNLFAVAVFGMLLLVTKDWKKIQKNDMKWFFLRSICGFVSFVTIYIAFNFISFSTNYFVSYAAATIMSFAIGSFLFGERMNKVKWIALFMSVAGLYLIYAIAFKPNTSIYIGLSFLGGLASAGWDTLSKKISGTYSNIQLNFFDFTFAATLPFIISLILKEKWTPISFTTPWIATFFFGIMYIATGILMVYGFKRVEAQIGSVILLLDVVIGTLLGFFIFKEDVSLTALIGGAMILSAIILPKVIPQKQAKK